MFWSQTKKFFSQYLTQDVMRDFLADWQRNINWPIVHIFIKDFGFIFL